MMIDMVSDDNGAWPMMGCGHYNDWEVAFLMCGLWQWGVVSGDGT